MAQQQKLFSYIRDFGIPWKVMMECLEETARRRKVTLGEATDGVLDHIESLQERCINQAAKHDMKLKSYQEKAA